MLATTLHNKNRILTINLSCSLQMSEPVWCMDTVNCQDGMIIRPHYSSWSNMLLNDWQSWLRMWKRLSCSSPHNNELCSLISITNCQSLWQFLFLQWKYILKGCESVMSTSWQATLMSLLLCAAKRWFILHVFSFKHLYTQITNFILPDFIPTLHFTSQHVL